MIPEYVTVESSLKVADLGDRRRIRRQLLDALDAGVVDLVFRIVTRAIAAFVHVIAKAAHVAVSAAIEHLAIEIVAVADGERCKAARRVRPIRRQYRRSFVAH